MKRGPTKNCREDPRFYMQEAIKAMKDSVDEKNKSTPNPSVGAVLVFPDGTYDIACRGEFREGDHAEYTLLDKKFRTTDVSNCWLFATLEPCCGPEARNEPKICCAERIANARITKVWYGVQELNPKAKGGKKYLEKMKVEVLSFDSDLHHEILAFNKDFNDWVEEENNKQKLAKLVVNGPLQAAIKNTSIDSLSKDALKLYINKTKKVYTHDSDELITDLINKNLMDVDSKSGEIKPTGDCILLFGKNPRDKFPQASVKAKVDYGGGAEPDTESFDDAIVLVPDQVKAWIKKVVPESIDRSNFTREKVSHFPPEVVREAIVNAIIHRDYSIKSAKVELEITPEKIEIRSPGGPISPNSIEDLQNFTAISQTRNSELAYIFNLMQFMEESGVGMDTYKTLREKYNLPLPIIKYKKQNVIVTFPRTIHMTRSMNEKFKQLNDYELEGLEYVKVKGELSKKEYAEHFNFDDKKAYRHLTKFKKLKLVGDNGEPPTSNNYKYVFKRD